MPTTSLRFFAATAALIALFSFTSCQRGEPLDMKVDASSAAAYQNWRANDAQHLTPDQAKALDDAVQEFKLEAQVTGATGEAIDSAALPKINGKTVRQAIEAGFGARLARLQQQRATIDNFLAQNAQLTTKPGDTASADYLRDRRDQQMRERESVDREITDTRDQLKFLDLPVPSTGATAADAGAGAGNASSGAAPKR
jgi:hypothetical protein